MPLAKVKQIKALVRSTEEAMEKVGKTDVLYKFGVQLQLPSQQGLTLEQVKTCLRKLEEALGAFQGESPIQFGLEVSHDSPVDKEIADETNKIFAAKTSIQQGTGLVAPESAVKG